MPEIEHKDINGHIEKCRKSNFDPVYLVYGDDYIRDQVTETLFAALLPDPSDRSLYLETIDAAEGEGVFDAIERINTLSFLTPGKVIRLKDGGLFSSGFQIDKFIGKIRDAHDQGNHRKAAVLFLDLLARRQVALTDAASGEAAKILNLEAGPDYGFLSHIARYCMENGLALQSSGDAAGALKNAVEKGFPRSHHLVLITDSADRRTALYKSIKTCGTVINCTVPQGSRQADRNEQRQVLSRIMQQALDKYGKTAETGVFDRIFDRTGFDPRAFSGNLEKLIHYAGSSSRITMAHTDRVIDRTREDPIYAFTGALAERKIGEALRYLASLLDSGYHYMQLLSAMINQVRKLLVIKTFSESREGGTWQPAMGFDRFRNQVLPAVLKFDEALLEHVRNYDSQEKSPGGKGSAKPSTELLIAKNPNNPYPVYQSFLQSDHYSLEELHAAIIKLHEADVRLKTTGQVPKSVLEHLIFSICRTD